MDVVKLLEKKARAVEKSLDRILPARDGFGRLGEAMRYSVFSGGKRVRPFLVLEAARLCGAAERRAMPLACAVEMIHTYSLVHDDLPEMDDDDLRRGKKTCHRQFDVPTAILAGDALLSQAFGVISGVSGLAGERVKKVITLLSEAIGPRGMVGGQALDMKHQGRKTDEPTLNRINKHKTGALITVCLEAGAVWGGGNARQVRALAGYGESIGFLFQLVDDIIDGDGYARLADKEKLYKKAAEFRDRAKKQVAPFGSPGRVLSDFADFLYERKT